MNPAELPVTSPHLFGAILSVFGLVGLWVIVTSKWARHRWENQRWFVFVLGVVLLVPVGLFCNGVQGTYARLHLSATPLPVTQNLLKKTLKVAYTKEFQDYIAQFHKLGPACDPIRVANTAKIVRLSYTQAHSRYGYQMLPPPPSTQMLAFIHYEDQVNYFFHLIGHGAPKSCKYFVYELSSHYFRELAALTVLKDPSQRHLANQAIRALQRGYPRLVEWIQRDLKQLPFESFTTTQQKALQVTLQIVEKARKDPSMRGLPKGITIRPLPTAQAPSNSSTQPTKRTRSRPTSSP